MLFIVYDKRIERGKEGNQSNQQAKKHTKTVNKWHLQRTTPPMYLWKC